MRVAVSLEITFCDNNVIRMRWGWYVVLRIMLIASVIILNGFGNVHGGFLIDLHLFFVDLCNYLAVPISFLWNPRTGFILGEYDEGNQKLIYDI